MHFRLFGINVQIQPFFWITAVLFGYGFMQDPNAPKGATAVWVGIVLVSILAHELGHAFAVKRHRIEPEITLHGLGGTTSWQAIAPLGRMDSILISAAGPIAGFVVGALVYAFRAAAPGLLMHARLLSFAVDQLLWVNVVWGAVNLLPVLPFDGGHVLEHALGPKRSRMTAAISFLFGMLIAGYAALSGQIWIAMLFGLGAMQSYQRYRAAPAVQPSTLRRTPASSPFGLPPEIHALLQSARTAIADDQLDRAIALAEQVLAMASEPKGGIPVRAVLEAHEVITWAHVLDGRVEAASDALARARKVGEPDAALIGAVLFARRDLKEARRVLEEARAKGDDRKEIVGPLIQILLEQGEVTRASAVAFDIVDVLSDDDARKMAQIAVDGRSLDWAARLYEAVFDRHGQAEDAYEAARVLAQAGQQDKALSWLRKAMDAGFSDRARAWSDAALEVLRSAGGFETVVPKP